MRPFTIRAPATIGNVGPGFDCLGLAIDQLYDEVRVEPADVLCLGEITGRQASLVPKEPEVNALTLAARAYMEQAGQTIGMRLHLHRGLPLAGGLGASAASAVAGAMAAAIACKDSPRSHAIVLAALKAEAAVAGAHLDNIAPCLYGGLVLIQDSHTRDPFVQKLPVTDSASWRIVVATPPQSLATKEARKILPTHLETSAWVAQMAYTAGVVSALTTGDESLLKQSLKDPFAEPKRAPLIHGFSEAKQAALFHGAWTFAISGGGPTVFSFCHETVADSIKNAWDQNWQDQGSTQVCRILESGATFWYEED